MADGSVKIDIVADNSDVEEKLKDTEESVDELGKKQKENQKETEKTTNKYKELTETIKKQEKELSDLKGRYTEAIVNFGKTSTEAEELAGEIKTLNSELKDNKKALGDASDEADKLTGSLDDNKGGFDLANVAAGAFAGAGLAALVGKAIEAAGALISLAEETREYREDLSKLEASYISNNKSIDSARKAYDTLYKIIGETDQTVEAAQQISLLAKSEAEVVKWSELAAGVVGKFGDALQPETFYESANETLKLGEATGAYTQMLEGTGYSVEKFNKGLAKLSTQAEKEAYMLEVTQEILGATATEYNSLTKSTQEARDATNRMEQAQARLGERAEPLVIAWTNLKTGFYDWAAGMLATSESADVLTESQREQVTASHEAAEAYREAKEAAHEAALAQVADADYAMNVLVPQLQELVDANGQVKKGYEERAAFLLEQMNAAWDTEYTKVSDIIGVNGQLKQSVLDVIEAQKAQILLAAHEEAYATAVQKVAEAEAAWATQVQAKAQAYADLQAAEEEYTRVVEENEDKRGYAAEVAITAAQVDLSEKRRIFREQKEAYEKAEADVLGYYADIDTYQTASILLMEGKTGEALSYLNDMSAGYDRTSGNVQKSIEEQQAALEKQAIDLGVKAVLMREAYEKGTKGVTESMVKTAEEAAETAATEFEKIGGQISDGIGKGADDKKPGLLTKIRNIVAAMKNAAEEEADINSPSKEFAWVGEMLMEGLGKGIDDTADVPEKATRKVFENLNKLTKDWQEKQVKTVADYNAEYQQEVENHNKTLEKLEADNKKTLSALEEKLIEDKKKKGADKAKLDKEYAKQVEQINARHNEAVEKENTAHASRLEQIENNIQKTVASKASELVQLGETYKNNVKKLWEDLDNSISTLQQNYDTQLASRTESIANSLNLWSKAEKNKVSGNELKRNLKSQVDMLEDFNGAIAKLEERGVSERFVNALKSMGVGATGEIEALAKMSDKALEDYVSLWEEKNALAAQAATEELEPLKAETEQKIQEVTEAAIIAYGEMREQFKLEGEKLAEELKTAMVDSGDAGYSEIINQIDDYTQAGADLMDGVVAGIVRESPDLERAVRKSVQNAIDAAKEEAGIASPSKVMKTEVGHNLAEGLKVGWADKMAEIRRGMAADMHGLTAQVKTAVVLDNARMAQEVSTRDTGFADVARAVGIQTAGINSLAGEYRKGTGTARPVILQLNGRELGRAVVDLGGTEEKRVGVKLSHGGVY